MNCQRCQVAKSKFCINRLGITISYVLCNDCFKEFDVSAVPIGVHPIVNGLNMVNYKGITETIFTIANHVLN